MKFTNINIGKRLGMTFGGIALLTLILGTTAWLALDGISERWHQFEEIPLRKSQSVSGGASALGDAIHHFKNYLLRGQDYDKKFNHDMDAIDEAVATYKGAGALQDNEKNALEQITKGAVAYRAAIKEVTALKIKSIPIEEIDKTIKGADKQIDSAFKELLAVTAAETVEAGKQMTQRAANGKHTIATMSIVVALLGALSAWLISRSITVPLNEAVRVARTVASGDLSSAIVPHSTDETGRLLTALRDMNGSLVNIVCSVRSGTDTIAAASRQIATGNLDLSTRTEEQASSLEHTAASMEKLTSTVKQNADNAREANRLAMTASDVAARGGMAVSQVVDTMAGINDSSRKIVDIIGVIDAIAFQTNILALNAAVEAARAGDQGRGFAVVAAEVRSLAQRSSAAAKEIKTLIDDSVDKVGTGTRLVSAAGATMEDVVVSVKQVTDIIAEISAASDEQSVGIDKIGAAISHMDQVTQQNAALVEEAAAAAGSMQTQAENLANTVAVFQLDASQMRLESSPRDISKAPSPRLHANAPELPARSVRQARTAALIGET